MIPPTYDTVTYEEWFAEYNYMLQAIEEEIADETWRFRQYAAKSAAQDGEPDEGFPLINFYDISF